MGRAFGALAAAALWAMSPKRKVVDLRQMALAVRRIDRLEAAATLAPAPLKAYAASLWRPTAAGECRVESRYGPTVLGARFAGRLPLGVVLSAPRPATQTGVAALWDRLRAAGFTVAKDSAAADMAPVLRPAAAVVRVLKEAPARQRRSARTGEERIAA